MGGSLTDLHHGTGLQQAHFFNGIEENKGHIVDSVPPFFIHTSKINQAKIRIGIGFLSGHSHFGRSRLVVEFYPEGLQEFSRGFFRLFTGFQVLPIKRREMPVKPAGIERIPGIKFSDNSQMDEPIILQRFMQGSRRMSGNTMADFRDFFQFTFATRIGFVIRQFLRQIGMPFGKNDNGFNSDGHRFQFIAFGKGGGIIEEIQSFDTARNILLKLSQALSVYLIIQYGMPGGALFHKFREDPGFKSVQPIFIQFFHYTTSNGAFFPERYDLFNLGMPCFRRNIEGYLGTIMQDVEIFGSVTTNFRVGWSGFWLGSSFPDDDFTGFDADRLILHNVFKSQRSDNRDRIMVDIMMGVEICQQFGALYGDGRRCLKAPPPKFFYSVIHC